MLKPKTLSSEKDTASNKYKFKDFFYEFDILLVLEGSNQPENLFPYCTKIKIESQYEDLQFPIVEMDLKLPKNLYHSIQKNYNKAFINFKAYKKQQISKGKYINRQVLIEPIQFMILGLDNHQPSREEVLYSDSAREADSHPGRLYETTIHLLDKDHIQMHRNVVNGVYPNITPAKLFETLFQIHSKKTQIIKTPDNNAQYENIIIPPMNVSKVVYYIQRAYGTYNGGLRYFQDFKYTWLLGKDKSIQPPGNNYEKVFIECVDPVQDGYMMTRSTFNDAETKTHYMRTMDQPIVKYADTSERDLNGDTVVADSTQSQHDSSQFNGTATGNLNNNIGVSKQVNIWNNYSHQNNVQEYLREQNEKLFEIQVTLPNQDYNNFQIDKKVQITSTAKNYKQFNHTCRISEHHSIFTRTDGETTWICTNYVKLKPF